MRLRPLRPAYRSSVDRLRHISRRETVERFLADGPFELDSNIVERAVRPQTLARERPASSANRTGAAALVHPPPSSCRPAKWTLSVPRCGDPDLGANANQWPSAMLDDLLHWRLQGLHGLSFPLTTRNQRRAIKFANSNWPLFQLRCMSHIACSKINCIIIMGGTTEKPDNYLVNFGLSMLANAIDFLHCVNRMVPVSCFLGRMCSGVFCRRATKLLRTQPSPRLRRAVG